MEDPVNIEDPEGRGRGRDLVERRLAGGRRAQGRPGTGAHMASCVRTALASALQLQPPWLVACGLVMASGTLMVTGKGGGSPLAHQACLSGWALEMGLPQGPLLDLPPSNPESDPTIRTLPVLGLGLTNPG